MGNYQSKNMILEAYDTLLKNAEGISLEQLLTLSQDTENFAPHRMAQEVEGRVETFARKHNIWIADRAEHYNTMTAYLHPPTSDADRLYYLGAYYAVLFFIDDVMGNEFRPTMTEEEKQQADMEMKNLLNFIQTGVVPENQGKLLPPIIEVLEGFKCLGDAGWVQHFLDFTRDHLALAVQDLDSNGLGRVLPLDEYVEIRNHVSGMYPAILMMEFAENYYLPRQAMEDANLSEDVARLEYLCAAIGGLVNDFFSFEKEVIEAQSDFNLIPVIMMNENLSLTEAIQVSADYTNTLYDEYKALACQVRETATSYPWGHIIQKHIDAMDVCNQAVWVWQIETERYLRDESVFNELRMKSPEYASLGRLQWLR